MADYKIYIVIGVIVLLVGLIIWGILKRYRKVKSDEILVVYGKTKGNTASKLYHGGAAFVWPVIQGSEVMSMRPMTISCTLDCLSAQKINVQVPVTVTTAISEKAEIMQNAAVRLLGLNDREKEQQVREVLIGQMRLVIATMEIEKLISDRDTFLNQCRTNIGDELKKFGLDLININIADIKDSADYIENLGKEAAAKARNEATMNIEKQEKLGQIGVETQKKERAIQLSEIERDKGIQVAENQSAQAKRTAEITKDQNTVVAGQKKEEAVKIREIEKDRAVETAEQEQLEATRLAEITKNREVEIATKESEQMQAVAEQEKLRDTAVAQRQAETVASVAKAENDAAAQKAEAEKAKEARIVAAGHLAEQNKKKAEQEREAAEAEYLSSKRQRAAAADKDAKVAENTAGVEVAKSNATLGKEQAEADKIIGEAKANAEKAVGIAKAQKDREVAIAQAEAKRAQLEAELISVADKEAERKKVEAEGDKAKIMIGAEAEAERILAIAKAKAEEIRLTKLAEAEGDLAKAQVQKALSQAETEDIANLVRAGLGEAAAISFILRDKYEGIIRGEQAKFEHLKLGEVKVVGDASQASSFLTKVVDGVQKSSVLGDLIPGLTGLLAKGTKFDQKQTDGLTQPQNTPAPDYSKPEYAKENPAPEEGK